MNFNEYFIKIAIKGGDLEGLPFSNPENLEVKRKSEGYEEYPQMIGDIKIGNEEDYQTIGVHVLNDGQLEIIAASQRIEIIDGKYKELFLTWLKE